ncbi:PadR family transcriptional regulator [Gulosibacter macacae]|uniref:PadR family transcriptional regulator n=1 Tax=Gulosibacter macacae TaxID=2488791 RepID=A0A3P3W2V1_9MICO|nr:PadR family transcriptional regulator [Gulosibacter macacae]RRJ88256.1 PadR family transcriptional regulator [Gulosibacter macacae]
MSLRAALLFLLSTQPMTGYDTVKQFEGSVGHVWNAPSSQIYPELRRMEAEGLIDGRDVPWGTKGATKREYVVTTRGYEAMHAWQREPLKYQAERDPARLKSAYLEWATADAARAHFEAHRIHWQSERERALDQLAWIDTGDHPTLHERLKHYTASDVERVRSFKRMSHQGTIARAEAEIAWAEACLEELGDYEGPLNFQE